MKEIKDNWKESEEHRQRRLEAEAFREVAGEYFGRLAELRRRCLNGDDDACEDYREWRDMRREILGY